MKKIIFLLLICIANGAGAQQQYRIDSILKRKGNTVWCLVHGKNNDDARKVIRYHTRGLGKPFVFAGDWLTEHPDGIGRRRVRYTRND